MHLRIISLNRLLMVMSIKYSTFRAMFYHRVLWNGFPFPFSAGLPVPGKGLAACLPSGKICLFCLLFPVRTTLLSGLSLNNFCYSYLMTAFPEKINTRVLVT
jgi:hypothetical protein